MVHRFKLQSVSRENKDEGQHFIRLCEFGHVNILLHHDVSMQCNSVTRKQYNTIFNPFSTGYCLFQKRDLTLLTYLFRAVGMVSQGSQFSNISVSDCFFS